jgi:hypothetical protein
MPLRPGLMWLTLNLTLHIQCFCLFQLPLPLRCLCVPLVEDHLSRTYIAFIPYVHDLTEAKPYVLNHFRYCESGSRCIMKIVSSRVVD